MTAPVLPFIDFYTQLDVIPTNQDISDLQGHYQRRAALYRQLGLPSLLLKGKSILEFGPGSGHNALYTASLQPARYVLVDGNPKSIEGTTTILQESARHVPISIVKSDILEFRSEEKFDVVFCEGLIPTQLDPQNFLRHVASFARPGGVVVITCMESISILSEVLRRYLCLYEADKNLSAVDVRLPRLVEFLKPHLEALPGMSRRHDDWVIDNILHNWSGPLFSIPEAIEVLHQTHSILGSSPHFLSDWRWYKQITKDAFLSSKEVLSSYWANVHSLIDCREVHPPRNPETNMELARLADKIYSTIFAFQRDEVSYPPSALAADLEKVVLLLGLPNALSTRSLQELIGILQAFDPAKGWPEMPLFCAFWGRGQQYISFINESR